VNKIIIRILPVLLTLLICLPACVPVQGNEASSGRGKQQIHEAAGPALLDVVRWQFLNTTRPVDKGRIYAGQAIDHELLKQQITQTLRYNNLEVIPPVHFRLECPPNLLVVSPRDRISYLDRVLLKPDLTTSEMSEIEDRVDKLNYSSLVVKLGGLGAAYPAIISPDLSPAQIINVAVEEWAHQFLALRPLGSLYLLDCLGIRQPPDIIVMNESLAGIIADEIGGQGYRNYYAPTYSWEQKGKSPTIKFDFDAEMRETRRNADNLLKAGEIEAAERYMSGRRDFFAQNGYAIRKINQAYFAFHSIYGDDPSAVSPVYRYLLDLKQKHKTLADFVNDVSSMTDVSQLKEAALRQP